MAVQGGERLIQQQHARIGHQDPRQSHPLLLTAGKLMRIALDQLRQAEVLDDVLRDGGSFSPIPLPSCTGADVLQHRHIGKQRVVLEQQTRVALLGGEIDSLFRVEERHAVYHDPAPVGLFDARDTFERHALAAARGAQEGDHLVAAGKMHIQPESTEAFFNVNRNRHLCRLPSLCRFCGPSFPAY